MSVIKDIDAKKEKVEALAAYAHEAWSGWMIYMFEKGRVVGKELTIPAELTARWHRQMITCYEDLPENEKNSDRDEARRMLKIMGVGDGL